MVVCYLSPPGVIFSVIGRTKCFFGYTPIDPYVISLMSFDMGRGPYPPSSLPLGAVGPSSVWPEFSPSCNWALRLFLMKTKEGSRSQLGACPPKNVWVQSPLGPCGPGPVWGNLTLELTT